MIINKLRSNKGESLAEVLVAITIGLFAILMLTSTITTSTKLDADSRELMGVYYNVNNELAAQFSGRDMGEDYEAQVESKTGTITITDGTRTELEVRVDYYTNSTIERDPVVAFRTK